MPAPATINNLLEYIQKSGLYDKGKLQDYLSKVSHADDLPPSVLAERMVNDGFLTPFQAKHLLKGRYRNFFIGKFKVLEPLGSGGMSHVYLCEHAVMKHRVAMKLLPVKEGDDKSSVTRFMREARAAAAVNHPNVVRAHDFDLAEKKFYYLIMDFVDGCNLHDLVKKLGPLPPMQAANYISQAAHGLNHILECGLIHRDLKPSNLLLDRTGTIRILDLGLARFTGDDSDNLTRQIQGKSILGTADFLAPEQAIQADRIDIRADIYSLGATLYFLLTGRAPFESQSVPQKLLSHQVRMPDAMTDVPDGLARICMKMLEKKAEDRYQTPHEVVDALSEWTTDAMPTPPEDWFQLRAGGIQGGAGSSSGVTKPPSTSVMMNQITPVRMARSSRPAPETGTAIATPTPKSVRIPPNSKSPSLPPIDSKPQPVAAPSRMGLWIGIAIAAVVVVGIAIAIILAFGGGAKPNSAGVPPGHPNTLEANPMLPPPPPGALVVGPGGVNTIAEAIAQAKVGDRIVVTADHVDGSATFTSRTNGVTVEPWPVGRTVPWTSASNHSSFKPLVQISSAEGVQLRGFQFDGKQQVDVLLNISGACPGTNVELCSFRGFRQAAAELAGAIGLADRPIQFDGVRFSGSSSQGAGVRVVPGTSGPTGSQHLRFANCRFEGEKEKLGAGLRLAASLEQTEFRKNRFSRLIRGIHYTSRGKDRPAATLTAVNNCFFELDTAFGFDAVPPAGSKLTLTNNLFLKTSKLANTLGVNGLPDCAVPAWICHDGDVKRKDGRIINTAIDPGVRYFRKTFDVKELPKQHLVLDIGAVTTFKAWLNGEVIGESLLPYFDKRIQSFPLAGKLKPGKNVLSVEVRHQADPLNPNYGSASGLMVRIGTADRDDVVVVKTDATWKSKDQSKAGWEKPEFSDTDWNAVHTWATDGPNWPWFGSVWDSAVARKLAGTAPLAVLSTGNFRDYDSNEGYPLLATRRGYIDNKPGKFPQNPDDDATFLRNPAGHALNAAGPEKSPVGLAFLSR